MDNKSNTLIVHIPHDLFQPSAFKTYDGCFDIPTFNGLFDVFDLKAPIKYEVCITNTGDAFLISGKAKADATTACSRCLEQIDVTLDATIDAYYMIEKPENYETEVNEFEVLPPDHNIDLGELILRSMVVDAPSKPICKDDCKGLCPRCGKNLNDGPCACKDDEPDETNPFSVLKDLKLDK